MRGILGSWLVVVTFFAVVGAAGPAAAKSPKGAPKSGAQATPAPATGKDVNACGCYKDANGACLCAKKGKCGCEGDCEPKGCEEKRQKEMEKEMAAEEKKAAEADKKQRESGGDKSEAPPPKKKTDGLGQ
ncbi:MAG TPA: hypothetical protein VHJ20_20345 [Polyangia bacterium]|nr:hypothetical protein [Polyangia bacterium]